MTKIVEITPYDDLDRTEKGLKTRASRTRFVGLDGVWVEVDVTEEHDAELERVVGRYMKAGVKPEAPPKPGQSHAGLPAPGSRQEAMERNKAMAAFAELHQLPYTPSTKTTGAYFPKATRQAYADHLAALAAVTGDALHGGQGGKLGGPLRAARPPDVEEPR
jgi:hypothetical protein